MVKLLTKQKILSFVALIFWIGCILLASASADADFLKNPLKKLNALNFNPYIIGSVLCALVSAFFISAVAFRIISKRREKKGKYSSFSTLVIISALIVVISLSAIIPILLSTGENSAKPSIIVTVLEVLAPIIFAVLLFVLSYIVFLLTSKKNIKHKELQPLSKNQPTAESFINPEGQPAEENSIELEDKPTAESFINLEDQPAEENSIELEDQPTLDAANTPETITSKSKELQFLPEDQPAEEHSIELLNIQCDFETALRNFTLAMSYTIDANLDDNNSFLDSDHYKATEYSKFLDQQSWLNDEQKRQVLEVINPTLLLGTRLDNLSNSKLLASLTKKIEEATKKAKEDIKKVKSDENYNAVHNKHSGSHNSNLLDLFIKFFAETFRQNEEKENTQVIRDFFTVILQALSLRQYYFPRNFSEAQDILNRLHKRFSFIPKEHIDEICKFMKSIDTQIKENKTIDAMASIDLLKTITKKLGENANIAIKKYDRINGELIGSYADAHFIITSSNVFNAIVSSIRNGSFQTTNSENKKSTNDIGTIIKIETKIKEGCFRLQHVCKSFFDSIKSRHFENYPTLSEGEKNIKEYNDIVQSQLDDIKYGAKQDPSYRSREMRHFFIEAVANITKVLSFLDQVDRWLSYPLSEEVFIKVFGDVPSILSQLFEKVDNLETIIHEYTNIYTRFCEQKKHKPDDEIKLEDRTIHYARIGGCYSIVFYIETNELSKLVSEAHQTLNTMMEAQQEFKKSDNRSNKQKQKTAINSESVATPNDDSIVKDPAATPNNIIKSLELFLLKNKSMTKGR